MAQNIVTISGMFGNDKTYFAGSPVVIGIHGLEWPESSPFTIVHIEVVSDNNIVGSFRADTGGQTEVSIDIGSALRAIWSDYTFAKEVEAANNAAESAASGVFTPSGGSDFDANGIRKYRTYYLRISTEYLSSDDGGVFTVTQCVDQNGNTNIPGGRCMIGWLTEWERSNIVDEADADASHLENTNQRDGDASTKPTSTPERVGSQSITSWVDVSNNGTQCVFYAHENGSPDNPASHAPIVLRDSIPYTDFLFVNRRGAIETCSAQMLNSMGIDVDTEKFARTERPAFQPSRSLMAISRGGRRSWSMSSGYQTREWAEWWTLEFLMARQWWMLCEYKSNGETIKKYIPVVVTPAKKQTDIYDQTKQQMPSVSFIVTQALEG